MLRLYLLLAYLLSHFAKYQAGCYDLYPYHSSVNILLAQRLFFLRKKIMGALV